MTTPHRVPFSGPEGIVDGYVECDPAARIHNADVYGPQGSHVVTIALPVNRAEALSDALELLDETAQLWASSEHIPTGWDELRHAIVTVTAALEHEGLIPADE